MTGQHNSTSQCTKARLSEVMSAASGAFGDMSQFKQHSSVKLCFQRGKMMEIHMVVMAYGDEAMRKTFSSGFTGPEKETSC